MSTQQNSRVQTFFKNCRRQKDDTKQVPYCGPTTIKRNRAKFSHQGDLTPGICTPLTLLLTAFIICVSY